MKARPLLEPRGRERLVVVAARSIQIQKEPKLRASRRKHAGVGDVPSMGALLPQRSGAIPLRPFCAGIMHRLFARIVEDRPARQTDARRMRVHVTPVFMHHAHALSHHDPAQPRVLSERAERMLTQNLSENVAPPHADNPMGKPARALPFRPKAAQTVLLHKI